ncbi:MAG: hypothetical protein JKX68_10450 [Flavobacteriales bacterium]|nr:hypothetical protein [Flavobacteriales bacterium]
MGKFDVIIIGGGAAGIFAAINIGANNPDLLRGESRRHERRMSEFAYP